MNKVLSVMLSLIVAVSMLAVPQTAVFAYTDDASQTKAKTEKGTRAEDPAAMIGDTEYDSLAAAAAAAVNGDVIVLKKDIVETVSITEKNITIDLNDHSFTGENNKKAALLFSKSKVTVKNGTFTGCKYTTGGAITANNTTIEIENVTFENNHGNPLRVWHIAPLTGTDPNPCKATIKD